jgi:hypothetical protein
MAEYMGSLQWYDLLCRPKLSCYDSVYEYMRLEPQREVMDVPTLVIDELLTSVALSAWWSVPLHREFAPLLLATDASTSYGFGGSVAATSTDEVRAISRLCAQSGAAVALGSDEAAPCDAVPHRVHKLRGTKSKFKTVFSIKAKHKAHINLMEASGLNLGLEWTLRNPSRHNKRIVILLDSRVVIGGAAKGRSSSKPLLRELRRTAALVLAGSLLPHYVHIGTKDNPADEPSRGVLHRSREPRVVRKWRHQLAGYERIHKRLVACGHLRQLSSDSGSNDTNSSV